MSFFQSADLKINGVTKDIYLYDVEIDEEISSLYEINLTFYTNDYGDFELKNIIGKYAQITYVMNDEKRFWGGIITFGKKRHEYKKEDVPLNLCEIVIRPDFFVANLSRGFKTYVEKSYKNILSEILDKYHVSKSVNCSNYGLNNINYTVQFNESDFNFFSRLAEKVGLFYFFEFKDKLVKLILSDNISSYLKNLGSPKIQFGNLKDYKYKFLGAILTLFESKKIIPAKFINNDYNFEAPSNSLKISNAIKNSNSTAEIYDISEIYQEKSYGNNINKNRLDAIEASYDVYEGSSSCPFFSAGYTFELEEAKDQTLNGKYVVTKITHKFKCEKRGNIISYENNFFCIKSSIALRPILKTKIPKISGYLSAVVTGPLGKVVYKDKFNRVKVKFFNDLSQSENENSSFWVRVSENFAGNGFGTVFTPRIGSEVIITFLNGDVDQPIIIGSVYNGDNPPPYNDKQETVSGIKTQTFKKNEGFNEISFDDSKDHEKIYLHAEKDLKEEIKENREIILEKGDSKLTIKKGNYLIELKEGDVTITCDNLTINARKDITINSDQNINLNAKQNIKLNADKDINFKAKDDLSSSAKNIKSSSNNDTEIKAIGLCKISAMKNMKISATQKLTASGMTGVEISSTSQVKISGTSSVKITSLSTDISGTANLKMSGLLINIKANGICNVGGTLTKLG